MSTTQKSDTAQGSVSDLLVKLGFKYDKAPMDEAIAGLKALREAADQAREALARLGEFEHGGITIKMVGASSSSRSLMTCEVAPPAERVEGKAVA